MTRLALLSWRELRAVTGSTAYRVSTLGFPVLVWAVVLAVGALVGVELSETPRVGLVDTTERLAPHVVEEVEGTVELVVFEGGEHADLDGQVRSGELAGWVRLDAGTLENGRSVLRTSEKLGEVRVGALREAVRDAVVLSRLSDPAEADALRAVLGGSGLVVERIGASKARSTDDREDAALLALMLAWAAAVGAVYWAVTAVSGLAEDRATGLLEVLAPVAEGWEIVLGRILGRGAAMLAQHAIWLVLAALPFAVAFQATADPSGQVSWALGAVLAGSGVLAVLSYLLYAGTFAPLALLARDATEAERLLTPAMLVMLMAVPLPIMLDQGLGTGAVDVALLVPWTALPLAYVRMAEGAPAWQPAVAVVVVVGTIVAQTWLGGRLATDLLRTRGRSWWPWQRP